MIGRRVSPSTQEEDKPMGFDDFELKLGDVMRGERATLSKSLLDVQRDLRIKAAYIAAIEAADLSAFETPSFVSGYVRSYARYLGLDADWAFEKFCRETGYRPTHAGSALTAGTVKPARRAAAGQGSVDVSASLIHPNTPFIPKPEGFWSKIQLRAIGSVIVLAALVGAVGYGGWSILRQVQRVQLSPVDQAPGVIADIDPIGSASAPKMQMASNDAAPQAPAPDSSDRVYAPQALEAPQLVSRDGPIASIDPSKAGVFQPAPGDQVAQTAGTAAPAPLAAATAADASGVRTVAAAAPGVEILAVRPSWVRVTAADGSVLLEKVMDAGERYAVPKLDAPPTLRTGESGAIYFSVDGVAHGPVGKRGVVTRNIVLSPEAIDEKYAVANIQADNDLAKMVAVADASMVLHGQGGSAAGE